MHDLEGLGVRSVSTGGGRFGVVTDAGDMFLVGDSAEAVDYDGMEEVAEVLKLVIGDDFEAALTGDKAYVRGNSERDSWNRNNEADIPQMSLVNSACMLVK
jgi:hypothetical protein